MLHPSPPEPTLTQVRVSDCMHHGILSCSADAPLGEVAAIMAKHHVHAVAVTRRRGARPIGIVSAFDVVAAAVSGQEPSALQSAATESPTISAAEPALHAAQLMVAHGVSHLVVVDDAGGYPVGIISTLDIAAVYAGAGVGEPRS